MPFLVNLVYKDIKNDTVVFVDTSAPGFPQDLKNDLESIPLFGEGQILSSKVAILTSFDQAFVSPRLVDSVESFCDAQG